MVISISNCKQLRYTQNIETVYVAGGQIKNALKSSERQMKMNCIRDNYLTTVIAFYYIGHC